MTSHWFSTPAHANGVDQDVSIVNEQPSSSWICQGKNLPSNTINLAALCINISETKFLLCTEFESRWIWILSLPEEAIIKIHFEATPTVSLKNNKNKIPPTSTTTAVLLLKRHVLAAAALNWQSKYKKINAHLCVSVHKYIYLRRSGQWSRAAAERTVWAHAAYKVKKLPNKYPRGPG